MSSRCLPDVLQMSSNVLQMFTGMALIADRDPGKNVSDSREKSLMNH